ncbi:MAG: DUF899 domain-containing protein [Acidimicrobiales bacterium]|jgi:predicted dithiol-disulfide oxidoreductase (DUF899 family)
MTQHTVVPHAEWLEARRAFLAREKEFSRQREGLAQQRRDLPWEAVSKAYTFEAPGGPRTLADLFDGRSQLFVYHFMFDPSWDEGCPHCSFWADNFEGAPVHLHARDVTLTAVSRAPLAKIAAYKERMGWTFPWVSSFGSDFNDDFGVSFAPEALAGDTAVYNYGSPEPGLGEREGLSVFTTDESGAIFHTYSAYARGIDMINGTYQILDLVPKGRDEPVGDPQFWVRRHDEYDT